MQRHTARFNVRSGPAVPVLGAPLGISDQLRRRKGAIQCISPVTNDGSQQQEVLALLAGTTNVKVIAEKMGLP